VAAVGPDTEVVVPHSLCAHPEWNVRALVMLGSPLGIRNVIRRWSSRAKHGWYWTVGVLLAARAQCTWLTSWE